MISVIILTTKINIKKSIAEEKLDIFTNLPLIKELNFEIIAWKKS